MDTLSLASRVAKLSTQIKTRIESITRERIDMAVTNAYRDMTIACTHAVAELAARAAAEDAAAQENVRRIVESTLADPSLPARFHRLFMEGAKSPSEQRRRLLAIALFGFGADTPERDRIDAAIERLFPADVSLLQQLAGLGSTLHSDEEIMLIRRPTKEARFAAAINSDISDGRHLREVTRTQPVRVTCRDSPLYALQNAGCVLISIEVGMARFADMQGTVRCAPLSVLPLGYALVDALRRIQIEIELRVAEQSPNEG